MTLHFIHFLLSWTFDKVFSFSSSVENQSLNEDTDEKNYATNIESEYLSSYSANQIPIVKFRPAILDFKQQ